MISVNSLDKFYGQRQILKDITFTVYEGEKVAIVGANGAGKTTLFRILTGRLDYDKGQVTMIKGKTVGMIDQIPQFEGDPLVEDVMRLAFFRVEEMQTQLAQLEEQLKQTPEDSALVAKYGQLSHRMEEMGGYQLDFKVDKVANGLDIDSEMRKKRFSVLSGGEKTRVNLARIILEDTDILLLDEPTNHLDMSAVAWLGAYLSTYKGTVLVISHDRYFLDECCERIIEIEDMQCEFYEGSYTYYAVEKQRRFTQRMEEYQRQAEEKRKAEDVARKMHQWGTEKMHKRAFSIDKRIAKMTVRDRPKIQKDMRVGFRNMDYETQEILKVKGIGHSFEGQQVLQNLSFEMENGERIAILGDNGTGKTTLLKIILGLLKPDEGKITFGPGLKTGYLPQIVHFENMNRNLIDTLIYEKNITAQTARNRLGAFHFSGEDQIKILSALSGGERSRLRLATLMYDQINLLLLDEPTNHLDIQSREWIESAVEDYGTSLIFVSHDRYFISRFATRILYLSAQGVIDFKGSFEEFMAAQETQKAEKNNQTKKEKPEKPKNQSRESKAGAKRLVIIEREIQGLEAQIAEKEASLADFSSDPQKLMEIMAEKIAIEESLEEKMLLWEQLASEQA